MHTERRYSSKSVNEEGYPKTIKAGSYVAVMQTRIIGR